MQNKFDYCSQNKKRSIIYYPISKLAAGTLFEAVYMKIDISELGIVVRTIIKVGTAPHTMIVNMISQTAVIFSTIFSIFVDYIYKF
jgi:hypothetical protein